jgi:RNA polymerase sigma-70 factor (ECF subfamily)
VIFGDIGASRTAHSVAIATAPEHAMHSCLATQALPTAAHAVAATLSGARTLPAPAAGWAQLAPHRAFLVQFARRRLHDPALAEDLVHDVFEAVVTGRAQFGGRSALRSWLVAILKHKIVDLVRQRAGLDSLDGDEEDGAAQALECPQPRPDEVAEQRERLRLTLARIATLPPTLRRTLEMRALHDASSEEICRELQISEQNLFVRLHRARKALAS